MMKKVIRFWTDPNQICYGKVKLDYVDSKAINQFLNNDLQFSEVSCLEMLDRIDRIMDRVNQSYEMTGNCCTVILSNPNISIINEYTNDVSENLDIKDFRIIIEKWLEFISTREPIEFSW